MLVTSLALSRCLVVAHAENNYIPELSIYQEGASPKIQVGVDIPNEDVLLKFGFDTGDRVNTYNSRARQNGDGGLSFTNEDKYNGDKSVKLIDTMTNHTGNYYWPPFTQANYSNWNTDDLYIKNGEILALSYKYKLKSGTLGFIGPYANTGFDDIGYTFDSSKDYFSEVVNNKTIVFDEDVDFTQGFPDIIKIKCKDGSDVPESGRFKRDGIAYVVTTKNGNYEWSHAQYTQRGNLLTLFKLADSSKAKDKFKKGEPVLFGLDRNVDIASFQTNVADNQWHKATGIAKLTLDHYNFETKGFDLRCGMKTNGVLYMDDIKFGYAPILEVKRDNSKVISSSYESSIVDKEVVITPNKPTVTKADTLESTVKFDFKADKKQETHSYQSRSKTRTSNTWSNWSHSYPITLQSTIVGYSIKVDKSPNTDPGKTKNNTSGSLSVSDYKRGDIVYCHIRTLDSNNQWSDVTHYKYVVGQTLSDYKSDIKNLEVAKAYEYGETETLKDDLEDKSLKLRTNPNLNKYTPRVEVSDVSSETEFKEGNKQVKIYLDKNN